MTGRPTSRTLQSFLDEVVYTAVLNCGLVSVQAEDIVGLPALRNFAPERIEIAIANLVADGLFYSSPHGSVLTARRRAA